MSPNPMQWIVRNRSIRQTLGVIDSLPGHALLILPTTRNALRLAREVCTVRDCYIMEGPVTSDAAWQFRQALRTPADVAKAFAGQPELPRTVVTFPDQLIGHDLSTAWLPFLGTRYSFSVIEALLALRHRPQVFALRICSAAGDFALLEVPYADLIDSESPRAPLQPLMSRLLGPLETELSSPPPDWLAARWLAQKSEAFWRFKLRDELKDMECLLRLHMLSPGCDRLRAGTAVAAVVARQKYMFGAVSP
jgi:hypothetical protein